MSRPRDLPRIRSEPPPAGARVIITAPSWAQGRAAYVVGHLELDPDRAVDAVGGRPHAVEGRMALVELASPYCDAGGPIHGHRPLFAWECRANT